MNQRKLIYLVLILLAVYLGIKIVKSLFPILLFIAIFAAVYAFIDPNFKAKLAAAIAYIKNRIF
jgi:uncharacterized membrane protein YbaN (DUF454 family)